jgi:nicotinate-nucleotide pyrophosphorylase (carboxylating)
VSVSLLSASVVDDVVGRALAEDAPWGDLTCAALVPSSATATAELRAREGGTFAGGAAVTAAFRLTDATVAVDLRLADGERFDDGAVLARVSGPASAVLQAERIALNFAQRLSGIATATAAYVAAVEGTGARIVDTRKTTPGLRALERHAVRCGGGHNHRFSLSDAVMVKDNHLAVLLAAGDDLTAALRGVRDRVPHTTSIEVEVDRLDQLEPVLAAGVDVVMLDNFTPEELREAVAVIARRAVVEASGGITLQTVRAVAETGVDVISIGALTHSVRSLDLGLDIDVGVGR